MKHLHYRYSMHIHFKFELGLAIMYEGNSNFAAKPEILLLLSPLSYCQNASTY